MTAAPCILGVDPGLSGAIAFFFPVAPDRVAAENMPAVACEVDCATLAARILQMGPALAVVERVSAMPGQGVSSTFKFGASYGAVRGVLAALQIRTHLVAPAVWKKHFRLDSDKEKARALALRLFAASPEHFSRKKDHNSAEAALLALYGASLSISGRAP
jgi:crossover junction endodeoxyribonuclease RuvC